MGAAVEGVNVAQRKPLDEICRGYGFCSRFGHKTLSGSDMFEMCFASTETLLSSLLSTCEATAAIAARLAPRARQEFLRSHLQDRALNYRRAANEIRSHGGMLGIEEEADSLALAEHDEQLACIDSVWEAVECSALICFRDALDAELPAEVHAAVRRWIEDGVSALERLRARQAA